MALCIRFILVSVLLIFFMQTSLLFIASVFLKAPRIRFSVNVSWRQLALIFKDITELSSSIDVVATTTPPIAGSCLLGADFCVST